MEEDAVDYSSHRRTRSMSIRKAREEHRAAHMEMHNASTSPPPSGISSRSSGSSTSSRSLSRREKARTGDFPTERENESHGNMVSTSHTEPRHLKKKSRSFTSRILGSSSRSSSTKSRVEATLPNVHRSAEFPSSLNAGRHHNSTQNPSSPMSCSSMDILVDEYKQQEPVSSMLPIKNILRKSKRHNSGFGHHADPQLVSRYTNHSGSQQHVGTSKSSRNVTVPQPFSFSHPRNKDSRMLK